MVINTNITAQSAAAQLMASSSSLAASLARLSSGSKIVSPADDSAGAAVSMKLTAQVARLNSTSNNVSNALSFAQTQDGYLQQVSSALNRMGELAMMAQDVTKTTSDRFDLNQEFHSLGLFVQDVANKTFNGISLFGGQTMNVTTDGAGGTFAMTGVNLNIIAYTRADTNDILTSNPHATQAHNTMVDVTNAIKQLASDRATLGANIEALTYYGSNLAAAKTNLAAANSQISDVNVAQESTNYARQNILVQSGTAMLAQANAMPNSVLKLLS